MNQEQEKFYQFIMQYVAKENQHQADALLKESFTKQDEGTFDQIYMKSFIPRMLELIQPEKVEQVKMIMMNHNKQMDDQR